VKERLNQLYEFEKFDEFAGAACQQFYAEEIERPSAPGG